MRVFEIITFIGAALVGAGGLVAIVCVLLSAVMWDQDEK
jgi:hypothetical protein